MTSSATHPSQSSDLRSYLSVARRRRWSIVLIALSATAAALFASVRQTPIYVSTSEAQVNPLDPDQVLAGFSWTFLQSMPSEVAIATSPQISKTAGELVALGGGNRVETGTLSVENPADTTILRFSYADPSPEVAQMWAQAFSQAYVQQRELRAEAVYVASTAGLQERVSTLQQELIAKQQALADATEDERQTIQGEINYLLSQLGGLEARLAQVPVPYEGATEILAVGRLPQSPSSPTPARSAALGLALGLALGVGLALIRERLDDRTTGKDEVESDIGAPVLTVVPKVEGWRSKKSTRLEARDAPLGIVAEAYRTARANIQFLSATNGVKTLVVTSAQLGEGKSTTAANLAVSLAQTGKRVIAISCDLRKPRLHAFFGLDPEPGLTELLRGRASFLEVGQRTGPETLRVVASGRVPQNPSELLASEQMGELLRDLEAVADFIVLDTPPILAVSDALTLAHLSDGVLVVAHAQITTRSALIRTRRQLEQVGSRIIGGIYNAYDPSRARAYHPEYYAGYYAHRDRTAARPGPEPPQARDGERLGDTVTADSRSIWESD